MTQIPMYELNKKLLGPLEPVGETNCDDGRFENLKQTLKLLVQLLDDIEEVATNSDSHEFSVSRAGKEAKQFLDDLITYKSEDDGCQLQKEKDLLISMNLDYLMSAGASREEAVDEIQDYLENIK